MSSGTSYASTAIRICPILWIIVRIQLHSTKASRVRLESMKIF